MNIWDRRAAQAKNEQAGINVTVDGYPGVSFTVRPLCDWNEEYLRAAIAIGTRPDVRDYLDRVAKPGYEPTEADKALDKAIAVERFVAGCVTGWSGVPAPTSSEPLEFNARNATQFFLHFPDIYATVRGKASDLRNFRPMTDDDKAAAVAGNSRRVSRSK